MNGPMFLALSCAQCHAPVELEFDGWGVENTGVEATWICPHCGQGNRLGAVGHVNWVRKAKGTPDAGNGTSAKRLS